MASPAFAAAGAGLAAAVVVTRSSDDKLTAYAAGAAAVAGALSGYAFWQCLSSDGASRALRALDNNLGKEVERHVMKICAGEPSLALRLAARASRDSKDGGLDELQRVCKQKRVAAVVATRAVKLLSRDLPQEDRDLRSLEDALALATLVQTLPVLKEDPSKTQLPRLWKKMSPQAQMAAISVDYADLCGSGATGAAAFCSLLEVIAAGGVTGEGEMPNLPKLTLQTLQSSWKASAASGFDEEFCKIIAQEHPDLEEVLASPLLKGTKIINVIGFLVQLLEGGHVNKFQRICRALAVTSHMAGFRLLHLARVKHALVETMSRRETVNQKEVNRAWNAFFYTFGSVATPCLVTKDRLEEIVAATASALPTPGGGPHGAIAAAHGTALLHMCLRISISTGGTITEELLATLQGYSSSFLQCARDDAKVYCGFLAAVYASSSEDDPERLRWLKRATEVPISVAELALKTGTACLHCKRACKQSLKGDWIAGAKMLKTALEISMKNVAINLRSLGANRYSEIGQRLAKLREFEPPWDDLLDFL